jgi:ribosomal protein S18 acetylase RimI-like enzyme
MPPSNVDVHSVRPDEWRELRDLRLRALTEDVTAFGDTLEKARARGDDEWRRYADDGERLVTFVATRDAKFVGMSRGRVLEGADAGLYGMWVAPTARRGGVGRRLVVAVLDWARTQGVARVVLDVAEERPAARALYAACGFVETGRSAPCESHAEVMELEMACALGATPR